MAMIKLANAKARLLFEDLTLTCTPAQFIERYKAYFPEDVDILAKMFKSQGCNDTITRVRIKNYLSNIYKTGKTVLVNQEKEKQTLIAMYNHDTN